jgi:hypothetical protein
MAPVLNSLISSVSKKKEPRCVCLSEAKASHSHKMWNEVSSSVPHFLQVRLLLSPITYKCLLKVLCPVRRPITTLRCVLLKDNDWALVASLGPEINSWACLCTHTHTHTHTHISLDSPLCSYKSGEQTLDHIIYDCKILDQERDRLKVAVLQSENWPVSKNKLINKFDISFKKIHEQYTVW